MKHFNQLPFLLIAAILLTGCGGGEDRSAQVNSQNSVDTVINKQLENAESQSSADSNTSSLDSIDSAEPAATQSASGTTSDITANTDTDAGSTTEDTSASASTATVPSVTPAVSTAPTSGDVDYDLTSMNSDMIYATVYQLMVNPEEYEGKTFRMKGMYSVSYYEPNDQYYHYCVVADAMACCSQGLEFVWEDGSHVYPAEYPEQYSTIVIEGTFETYREEGNANLYCHLANCSLNVAQG